MSSSSSIHGVYFNISLFEVLVRHICSTCLCAYASCVVCSSCAIYIYMYDEHQQVIYLVCSSVVLYTHFVLQLLQPHLPQHCYPCPQCSPHYSGVSPPNLRQIGTDSVYISVVYMWHDWVVNNVFTSVIILLYVICCFECED